MPEYELNDYSQILQPEVLPGVHPRFLTRLEVVPHGNLWLGVNYKTVRGLR